jgi:hypothetical protein
MIFMHSQKIALAPEQKLIVRIHVLLDLCEIFIKKSGR